MKRLLTIIEVVGTAAVWMLLMICVVAGALFVVFPLIGPGPRVPAAIGLPALAIDLAMIVFAIYRGSLR